MEVFPRLPVPRGRARGRGAAGSPRCCCRWCRRSERRGSARRCGKCRETAPEPAAGREAGRSGAAGPQRGQGRGGGEERRAAASLLPSQAGNRRPGTGGQRGLGSGSVGWPYVGACGHRLGERAAGRAVTSEPCLRADSPYRCGPPPGLCFHPPGNPTAAPRVPRVSPQPRP